MVLDFLREQFAWVNGFPFELSFVGSLTSAVLAVNATSQRDARASMLVPLAQVQTLVDFGKLDLDSDAFNPQRGIDTVKSFKVP